MRKKIFFLLMILLGSCSKDEVDNKGSLSSSTIDYSKGVLVIEKSLKEAIVSESKEAYTIKKDAFSIVPKVGEVILVPGEWMRKVKSVRTSGSNYVIDTEDAVLTEVIKNGTIAFDVSPEWEDATSLRIAGKEMLSDGQGISLAPIEHQVSVGGVDHKIVIQPNVVNGKINSCSFKFEMSKGSSTAFVAEGTASLPSQQALIVIEDGKLKDFNANNKSLKADFSVRMATAGGSSGEHSLKLPEMAISFPIRFIPSPAGPIPNPIPMTIDVGIQFVSQMTIPDPRSSATGKSRVSFDANAGFEFKGSEISTSGKLNNSEVTDGEFGSAANIGLPIDLQFGLAFPRVSFKIAGQELAFVHVGYSTGSRLKWGPLCKSGYSKVVVEGGYELKVLGQTLSSNNKTFVEMNKIAGDACN